MRKRPSERVPGWAWGVGGAAVALALAVPLLRQERAEPEPQRAVAPPAVAAPRAPASVPASAAPKPAEPTLEERRGRYVGERTRELVAEMNAGLRSSQVGDKALAADRTIAEARAEREWAAFVLLAGGAEALGRRAGEVEVYRVAADRCWPVVRDVARYEAVGVDVVKRLLEEAADQERLARRIGGR